MFIRFFFGFITVCVFGVAGVVGYFYSQTKVDFDNLVDYNPPLSSQIYGANGELIANIFDKENRLYVRYEDIPSRMIEALVAIEDTSFFEHGGVNYEAITRALVKDIKAMKFVEGASTITQQLVKNVVLSSEKKVERKIKEIFVAMRLEGILTKEQILERYFNEIYLGHGYYGVKTAAKGYFHKELNELTLKEIAILVGLPKAPSSYDPTRHLDLSVSRANQVIFRMHDIGWITKDEYEEAMQEVPMVFDDTLTLNQAPYVTDEVLKEASKLLPDIKTGGYKIYTSVDLKVQKMAENALKNGYNEILKRNKDANESLLNGAMTVTNPTTGDVIALVGGVDYQKSNFNRATQSKRQTGSSFKPFIYQIALDSGLNPSSEVADIAKTFDDGSDKEWTPKNYGKKYDGYITMRTALAKSRNLATVNLMNSLGAKEVADRLNSIGFNNVPPMLSVALGSYGIAPLEYAKFYSIFPGYGVETEPRMIKQIDDKNGNQTFIESKKLIVTSPEQAYLMIDMMKDVVTKGTARRAGVKGIEVAGKTGTSNDSIDSWFCGYTPELLVIIWYGNDNHTPMRSVETGSRNAAPAFAEFMNEYIKEFPGTKRRFSVPNGVKVGEYDGKKEIYTETSPLPIKTVYEYQNTYDSGVSLSGEILF
ncbi:MAG: PBP1A family penicillin-binding protein [Campylobacter sp.]|nr:PBP1A family penicillin-binding protein [Campylobacter sp.]